MASGEPGAVHILGSRHDHLALGLPGELMKNSLDLGTALSGFAALQDRNSRGATVYLRRAGEHFVFGYGVYASEAVAREQINSVALAVGVNIISNLTLGAVKPLEVMLSSRAPVDVDSYESLLGAPVRFDQPETGLVLHGSSLRAPILGASLEELERLRQCISAVRPISIHPWTDRVKHAVRPLLLEGNATTAGMAKILNVNLRTLSRRLEAEETTFQKVLESVRYSMARELLEITDLQISEISTVLCYTEHSSFSDAFRRWSGVTPSEWRSMRRDSIEDEQQ
jgi:AraC-like DNA-binding protein